jgi:hypothetical protein
MIAYLFQHIIAFVVFKIPELGVKPWKRPREFYVSPLPAILPVL